jgi:hypothetical protein
VRKNYQEDNMFDEEDGTSDAPTGAVEFTGFDETVADDEDDEDDADENDDEDDGDEDVDEDSDDDGDDDDEDGMTGRRRKTKAKKKRGKRGRPKKSAAQSLSKDLIEETDESIIDMVIDHREREMTREEIAQAGLEEEDDDDDDGEASAATAAPTRRIRTITEYLIRWKGWSFVHATWHTRDDLR